MLTLEIVNDNVSFGIDINKKKGDTVIPQC